MLVVYVHPGHEGNVPILDVFNFPRSLGNLACGCGRDEVVDASECSVSFFNCIIDPCIRGTDVVPPNFPDVFSDV